MALGEVAIYVVEREVGDAGVHVQLAVVPHLGAPIKNTPDQIKKTGERTSKNPPKGNKPKRRTRPGYLGDEPGGLAAGGGGGGGDGRRVVALGVEEAGDRLVGGAGERVLEVELVLVRLHHHHLLRPRRHVHGRRPPPRSTRKAQEHAKKPTARGAWLYGGEGEEEEEEEATIAATQCYY